MKFRCEREILADALTTAGRAATSRTGTLPVLSGVRLDVGQPLATADELTRLPGVGNRIASRIVALRGTKGRFVSVEELIEVRGIGRITLGRTRGECLVRRVGHPTW